MIEPAFFSVNIWQFGRKSLTLSPKVVLRLMTFVFLLLVNGCSSSTNHLDGTEEERAYDALQLKGEWEQIVEKNAKQPTQSLPCHKVVRLALYRLGQAGEEAVFDCLSDAHEVLTNR